jgi:hypothetical protein
MPTREAACSCGPLTVVTEGEPTVSYVIESAPERRAVPVGAFAEP